MGTRRLAIALVLLLTTVAAARQPAARPAGEVVIHSIAVDALKNNLLGDPAQRNVAVYLPPTYKTRPPGDIQRFTCFTGISATCKRSGRAKESLDTKACNSRR